MWSHLKTILKDKNTRCIIIEDGEPKYIVLPFAEYQHLQSIKDGGMLKENSENKEWQETAASASGDDYASSVNIEDLPF